MRMRRDGRAWVELGLVGGAGQVGQAGQVGL